MFADATSRPRFKGASLLAGVGRFFVQLHESFVGALNARRVYQTLSRMSDEQLAARGLTRSDISRLTQEALFADETA